MVSQKCNLMLNTAVTEEEQDIVSCFLTNTHIFEVQSWLNGTSFSNKNMLQKSYFIVNLLKENYMHLTDIRKRNISKAYQDILTIDTSSRIMSKSLALSVSCLRINKLT